MPMYEYKCLDCGKEALVSLSLKDHDTGAVSSVPPARAREWSSLSAR